MNILVKWTNSSIECVLQTCSYFPAYIDVEALFYFISIFPFYQRIQINQFPISGVCNTWYFMRQWCMCTCRICLPFKKRNVSFTFNKHWESLHTNIWINMKYCKSNYMNGGVHVWWCTYHYLKFFYTRIYLSTSPIWLESSSIHVMLTDMYWICMDAKHITNQRIHRHYFCIFCSKQNKMNIKSLCMKIYIHYYVCE